MNAIDKTTGPCVILAGAGTGKTYTIVEKVKKLIKDKVYSPERIVCITFSNEAANSLLARVQKVLEKDEKEPIVRTFHAFSGDLLREHGNKIGIKQDFAIIEPDDAKVMLHRNMKIAAFYCHKYISTIGAAKDFGITLEQMQSYVQKQINSFGLIDLDVKLEQLQFELQTLHLKKDEENKRALMMQIRRINNVIQLRKFASAWGAYEKLKIRQNCLDYSDLNKFALQLLEKCPEVANEYDYIVVDEFQDTNKIQLDFLRLLALKKNITVVGDMNQSIYRFRGAYRDNYNLFKKYFNVSNSDIFNLDKSRRSSNKILRTAHKLILNNYADKNECFFVESHDKREGKEIECYEMKNAREEARKVVELIKEDAEKGIPLEEICVMFRNHHYGRVIRMALDVSGIPYVSVTKESLLKHKNIKMVIAYLDILSKMHFQRKGGEGSWWNLLHGMNFPEDDLIKIGKFMKPKNRKINDSVVNGNKAEVLADVRGGNDVIGVNGARTLIDNGSGDNRGLNDIAGNDAKTLIVKGSIDNGGNGLSDKGSIDVSRGSVGDNRISSKNGVGDNNSSAEDNNLEDTKTITDKIIWEFEQKGEIELSDNARMLGNVLVDKLRDLLQFADKPVAELIREVYKTAGYSNEKEGSTREQRELVMNLDRFYDLARDHTAIYGSELSSFINYLEILDSLGIEIESVGIDDIGVRLMTSHATKGLEYRTVIVTNLANKRFPMERINTNPLIPLELSPQFAELKHLSQDDLEEYNKEFERMNQLMEERRLCYVAFTRAKERLILTFADEYANKRNYASQFLNEIDYRTNKDIIFKKDMDEKFPQDDTKGLSVNGTERLSYVRGGGIGDNGLVGGMRDASGVSVGNKEFVSADKFKIEKNEKADRSKVPLSPSALKLFDECEKQFEYKYVYNMPEKKPVSWDAIQLGSFVHLVLEEGVKKNWRTLKEFIDYSKELHLEEEWEEVALDEVEHILKVFYARNKDKYDEKSKTEIGLYCKIDGINFTGFADRIDFRKEGLEIIDYKTGKSIIAPKERNWQLGYYAIAATEKFGKIGKVRKITLETLKQDTPLEFEVFDNGDAISVNSNMQFNINDVKAEILEVARRIHKAYVSGFKPCPIEKNCEFCNEYIYDK